MSSISFIPPNEIRKQFTQAMSEMYQIEVPLYRRLLSLVNEINESAHTSQITKNEAYLLTQEHHGAIRLGTAAELSIIRRLFAVMNMHPVDYYDLSAAGIPVHSTAFRALNRDDLQISPFRIFCSLLRLDLIKDKLLAQKTSELLDKRQIIPEELLKIIQLSEEQGGLAREQVNSFVEFALEVFRWHQNSSLDKDIYEALRKEHTLIADVVSFKGPHINHLTPKVLDIDECQKRFVRNKIKAKAFIEGPPTRKCSILLRQTSFLAIAEKVIFSNGEIGEHTARFGEVEQRGIALTPKGRALYDTLLVKAKNGNADIDYNTRLKNAFIAFPDDYDEIRQQELGYFYYSVTSLAETINTVGVDIESLLKQGVIKASPIIYEDFLPISAAGIFASNLSNKTNIEDQNINQNENNHLKAFENALGVGVFCSFDLYEELQKKSVKETYSALGISLGNEV